MKPYTLRKSDENAEWILDYTADTPIRVLQLTDMQIISLSCTRNPTRDRQIKGAYFKEGVASMDTRCFSYVEELVQRVEPDLILLTGDNVYGEFDDLGEMQTLLCRRIEEYGVLWAPVFGNHDNESRMGVRWQIEQFLSSPHCLFSRGNVTGNGNYALRIRMNGRELFTLYMLDTSGCHTVGNPWAPEEGITEDNIDYDLLCHTGGIYPDQIAWYEHTARKIAAERGEAVPSLAFFHIPLHAYDVAMKEKYGYVLGTDFTADKDGDFGVMCEHNGKRIDRDLSFYNAARSVGTVGFFAGHEHKNDLVMYHDGVCFAYGVKTGVATYYRNEAIGGTVITLHPNRTFTVHHEKCEKRLTPEPLV